MKFGKGSCHPFTTKLLYSKEESLSDRDFDIFDSILSVNDMYGLKGQIMEESKVK